MNCFDSVNYKATNLIFKILKTSFLIFLFKNDLILKFIINLLSNFFVNMIFRIFFAIVLYSIKFQDFKYYHIACKKFHLF